MSEQIGWRGFVKNLKREAPQWATPAAGDAAPGPQVPLAHQVDRSDDLAALKLLQQRQQRWISLAVVLALVALLLSVARSFA